MLAGVVAVVLDIMVVRLVAASTFVVKENSQYEQTMMTARRLEMTISTESEEIPDVCLT